MEYLRYFDKIPRNRSKKSHGDELLEQAHMKNMSEPLSEDRPCTCRIPAPIAKADNGHEDTSADVRLEMIETVLELDLSSLLDIRTWKGDTEEDARIFMDELKQHMKDMDAEEEAEKIKAKKRKPVFDQQSVLVVPNRLRPKRKPSNTPSTEVNAGSSSQPQISNPPPLTCNKENQIDQSGSPSQYNLLYCSTPRPHDEQDQCVQGNMMEDENFVQIIWSKKESWLQAAMVGSRKTEMGILTCKKTL